MQKMTRNFFRIFALVLWTAHAQIFEKFHPKKVEDVRGGSKLSVTYPPNLVDLIGSQGHIKSSLGNFGHIQYGTNIVGQLKYDSSNTQGCTPFNKTFSNQGLILVFAGGCPVTTKVRNIENAGGQLAIIGNGYSDTVEAVWAEDLDGSGFSLITPALLIEQDAALLLETAVQNDLTVKLKANIEIAHTGSTKADVTLWYGNIIDLPPDLIEDLYNYQHIWKKFAKFTPRILTIACPNCP